MKQASAARVMQDEEHHWLTLQALDDVDARRTIDASTIQAWATSLATDTALPAPFDFGTGE